MDHKDNNKKMNDELHLANEVDMRSILQNAIKMHALYKGHRVTIIDVSQRTN